MLELKIINIKSICVLYQVLANCGLQSEKFDPELLFSYNHTFKNKLKKVFVVKTNYYSLYLVVTIY